MAVCFPAPGESPSGDEGEGGDVASPRAGAANGAGAGAGGREANGAGSKGGAGHASKPRKGAASEKAVRDSESGVRSLTELIVTPTSYGWGHSIARGFRQHFVV